MIRQSILRRIEKLENEHGPDRLVIVPSWGEYVYIDGKPIPKAEYKTKPDTKTITIGWGDDHETPKNPGKIKK